MTAKQIIAFVRKCQDRPLHSDTLPLCEELLNLMSEEHMSAIKECSQAFQEIFTRMPL